MKVFTISIKEVKSAVPVLVKTEQGAYWAFHHGEKGRGRWEVRIPLAAREFPTNEPPSPDQQYKLVDLHKQDPRGNRLFLLAKNQNEQDKQQLILLYLSPGFRGSAYYKVQGHAEVIAEGYEAQGTAGRMGGSPCPVILVKGPTRISWERTGRLYGSPAKWIADFDGNQWIVAPEDECVLTEAALNY